MKHQVFLASMLGLSLLAAVAHATNGYFTDGVGVKSMGLAGAGSADPSETMIMATNPAGLAFVPDDLEVGLELFSPDRSYSTSASQADGEGGAFTIGPNSLVSADRLFPIPYIAIRRRIDAQNSLGVAFYGRGGMATSWSGGTATFAAGPGAPVRTLSGTFGAGDAGVNLMQAFLNVGFAHLSADRHFAVGVSLIFAAQRFTANGLGAFAGYTEAFAASGGTVMPRALSNTGADMAYGGGASVGIEWRPLPRWAVAAAYTSKMYMSRFTRYSDLFAGHGAFDIPANATFGLTFKPRPSLALDFDTQRIWYGSIAAIADPVQNIFGCPTAGAGGTDLADCLGGATGAGFGWQNMTIYKFGVNWRVDPTWTVRFGASHGAQPIPSSQMTFNILAPGVIEDHFALGFTHHGARGDFSAAFTYAPTQTISGPNTFDPTQTIRLSMHQFIVDFGYAWKT